MTTTGHARIAAAALVVALAAATGCKPKAEPPDQPVAVSAPAAVVAAGGKWTLAAGNGQRTASTDEPGPRALPGIAWTNPVAKEIVSEPVFGIAAGRPAVLMTSDMDVLAFDLESGKLLWSRALPSSINASPLIAGGHAWIFAMESVAFQLNPMDGAIVKQIDQDFTLEASPLLAGDTLVFEQSSLSSQVPESRLLAIDPATGSERWHYDYARAAGRAPATDGTRVFAAANDGVHAVSLADGKKVWSHPQPVVVRVYSPMVANGMVIIAGGSHAPGRLTALDAATGAVRWEVVLAGRIGAPPAIVGSEVLVPVMDGKIHRHSLADGKDVGTLDPGGRTDARPVASATRIYVPVGQTVVAFDRATMMEAWRIQLEDLAVSDAGIEHLAVMGTKLIVVRLDGHVHALEAAGGS